MDPRLRKFVVLCAEKWGRRRVPRLSERLAAREGLGLGCLMFDVRGVVGMWIVLLELSWWCLNQPYLMAVENIKNDGNERTSRCHEKERNCRFGKEGTRVLRWHVSSGPCCTALWSDGLRNEDEGYEMVGCLMAVYHISDAVRNGSVSNGFILLIYIMVRVSKRIALRDALRDTAVQQYSQSIFTTSFY